MAAGFLLSLAPAADAIFTSIKNVLGKDKKAAQLDKALDYANRAKTEVEATFAKAPPAPITSEQWTTDQN